MGAAHEEGCAALGLAHAAAAASAVYSQARKLTQSTTPTLLSHHTPEQAALERGLVLDDQTIQQLQGEKDSAVAGYTGALRAERMRKEATPAAAGWLLQAS